jgi:hypothetical protein
MPSRTACYSFTALAGAIALAPTPTGHPTADTSRMIIGTVALQSAGPLAFGPDGTLFLADSRGAAIYALDVGDAGRYSDTAAVEVPDIDGKIAAALGTTRDQIRIASMAVHPRSKVVYLAVTRGRGDGAAPLVVRVRHDGSIEELRLDPIRHASVTISDPPSPDAKAEWGPPPRQLTVTDLAFRDGMLYASGLSNKEFSSTLRRFAFPFQGSSVGETTVEVYHTSHDRYETASPITAFLPITIGGTPTLLAGYGCSPIATFALQDLGNRKHVRGKTVAELGGGNRPMDMLLIRKKGKDQVLIANSDRTLLRLSAEDIARAPAMTKPVSQAYQAGGVPQLAIARVGVRAIEDLNGNYVLALQRDVEDGTLNLTSFSKEWL